MKRANYFILSIFIITILITKTCYAKTEWNLNDEQEVFTDCIMAHNNTSYPYNDNFTNISTSLINEIFSYVKSGYENNNISQEDYPTLIVTWYYRYQNGVPRCTFYFLASNETFYGFTTNAQSLSNNCPMTAVVVDKMDTSPEIISSNFQNPAGGNNMIFFDGASLNFFMLTDNGQQNNLPNTGFPFYVDGFKREDIFSEPNEISSFNPETLDNNFILNKEFKVGYNFNYTYDYYYLDNENQKISIKEYVSFQIDSFWNENNYIPYINKNVFENIPNNTNYYFDLFVTGKGNLSNYTEIINNQTLVFKTTSSTTPTPTPSGDSPSDGGNYTNQLDNINNNITNSTTQIIQNQSQNTQTITNTISGESEKIVNAITTQNENYWGNSGELDGEKQSGEVNNLMNEIIENVSGEITKNEVIGALQEAEQGFFNIIEYGKSNPNALDFILEWEDIKYNDITLIPGNSINFSAYCREIPELGMVQTYIRIIAVFEASIAIIIQIYNLILSTLGIDNPYLYEEQSGEYYTTETFNESTGEHYITQTQTNGRGSSISHRYNKTPEPTHRRIGF